MEESQHPGRVLRVEGERVVTPSFFPRLHVILLAMRPLHWLKSLCVLSPVLFGGLLGNPTAVKRGLLAFLAFSLMPSGLYLINDPQ